MAAQSHAVQRAPAYILRQPGSLARLFSHQRGRPMDRIYLAIIVSALLLLLSASGLYVTSADLIHPARTVGVNGRGR